VLACKRRYGKCSHHPQSRQQSPSAGRRDQCPVLDPETRTWEKMKEECAKKRGKANKGCSSLSRTGSEEWVARRTFEMWTLRLNEVTILETLPTLLTH
jgi:hypothetical protein